MSIHLHSRLHISLILTILKYGSIQHIDLLFRFGVDINIKDSCGLTALCYTMKLDDYDSFSKLLELGADANTENMDDKTLLMIAASLHNGEKFIDKILNYNADINHINHVDQVNHANIFKMTALMYAALNGNDCIVRKLISAGADIHSKSHEGATALMFAASHVNCLEILINAGANIIDVDTYGFSVLHQIISDNNDLCFKKIMEYCPIGAINDRFQENSVLFSINSDFTLENLKILINAGININVRNENGVTPLMWFLLGYMNEHAQLLIDAGADLTAKNDRGSTVYDCANGEFKIILKKYPAFAGKK